MAEVLDTWLPAGRRRPDATCRASSSWSRPTSARSGTSGCAATGVALLDTDTLLDDDAHPARAEATGTASDLALALWGRVTFDVLETAGDETLLEALRVS